MKEVIDFFRRLHDDNTREWFDAHRAEWTRVKGRFADFTGQLIGGIASFDPEVRGLRPQDCTYRIARFRMAMNGCVRRNCSTVRSSRSGASRNSSAMGCSR